MPYFESRSITGYRSFHKSDSCCVIHVINLLLSFCARQFPTDTNSSLKVLRYIGVVDVVNQRGLVKLQSYKKDHPFAQLLGSDKTSSHLPLSDTRSNLSLSEVLVLEPKLL